MKNLRFLISAVLICLCTASLAQETTQSNVLDDIQVDIKSASVNKETDSLIIELFLISYQMEPREFKLNTFATQVIDDKGGAHLYTQIKMGRVLVDIADRQNYLHYLLEENVPVPLTIKIANWQTTGAAKKIALVFEDSTEEGKFITQEVDL